MARERMRRLQRAPDAPRYLLDDIAADMLERLAFVRHAPRSALVIGDVHGTLNDALTRQGCAVTLGEAELDEERPLPCAEKFDLIASLATLDTVNDLPGALVHLRAALAPGGLLLASFAGAGSLAGLRAAMLAADGERPAPRMHPMVDVRAAAALLQRAGFADPVADGWSLAVRFSSFDRLVSDMRAQGLGNVLARPGPPLGKAGLARAVAAFEPQETIEVVTLTGWKPS
ncbi:MAG TPA: methyltransferase domain-containing protein [Novosphingobium sp.]|nr:methyltransferase domain-containing protein [Novosphingobium sp.]